MRRFAIVGQRAHASQESLLGDIPGTTGRLDVLLRCLRAALLVSHGVRRDTVAYLVLLGDPGAPRTIRVDGASARYLRPDERSLAVLVRKVIVSAGVGSRLDGFVEVRPGVAVAAGGVETVLLDAGNTPVFMLDEVAADVRRVEIPVDDVVFFVGDHLGFDAATRATLAAAGATAVSVGPTSVHAEDAVTLVTNECDRRTRPK